MDLFLSRFDNKVDAKGRVSVPAPFRTVLERRKLKGIVAYPSPRLRAVDACGEDRIARIAESLDQLNPYGATQDALTTAIFSRSHPLQWDSDGRIVLPKPLMDHAGIDGMATFAGRGQIFQIWSPAAYDQYERDMVELAEREAPGLSLVPQGAAPGRQEAGA